MRFERGDGGREAEANWLSDKYQVEKELKRRMYDE